MPQFTEQGTIDLNAGDVGGDIQATDAASRRFVRDNEDGTFLVIDVTAYGIKEDDDEGDWHDLDVQAQFTLTECTDPDDPGSTDLATDIQYEYPYMVGPGDLIEAHQWAVSYVRSFDPTYL